jgi:hypothetical protein
MLFQTVSELVRAEILAPCPVLLTLEELESNNSAVVQAVNYSDSMLFKEIAQLAEGMSGRWLRKVAIMAFAQLDVSLAKSANKPNQTLRVQMKGFKGL